MKLQIIIIAGGLATRLGTLTSNKPKSLIDINGDPFIIHQLRYLKNQGFKKIHLCLGFLADQIITTLKHFNYLDLNITYSLDGDNQLGTGGALKNALDKCEDYFFVQYGDSYLPINYSKIYDFFVMNKSQSNILTIYENNSMYDKSNVIYTANKIFKYDKNLNSAEMNFIDYGLSLLKKDEIIPILENNISDLSEVYKILINENKMIPYIVKERFYEIGKPEGIADMKKYIERLL
tara:strand:- start:58 stop:762 length:705 start_codon:yes stop_codon:yes gene_type:complete